MASIDPIKVISDVIAIIQASIKIYEAASNASGLPRVFRDVAARLPVIWNTLETAKTALAKEMEGSQPDEPCEALATVLESCLAKVTALKETLLDMKPKEGASSLRRCIKAVRTLPLFDKIKPLMDDILGDVQLLAANYTVKSASRLQPGSFPGVMQEKETRGVSRYTCTRVTIVFYNTGPDSKLKCINRRGVAI